MQDPPHWKIDQRGGFCMLIITFIITIIVTIYCFRTRNGITLKENGFPVNQ